MNALELKQVISTNYTLDRAFVGIFSADTLKNVESKFKDKTFCIVNTDTKNNPGKHWLCITKIVSDDHDHILYEIFDSLGKPEKFIKKYFPFKGEIEYVKTKLQSNKSNSCGLFVLAFIFHRFIMTLDWSLSDTVNDLFTKNVHENEIIVQKFKKKMMKKIKKNQ